MNRRTLVLRAILLGVATIAVAVAVAAIFLRRYPDGQPVVTRDIPHYIWRIRLASANGIDAFSSWHPPNLGIQPERAGLLVLLGLVHVSGATTLALAVRAVAAVATGLAAGAFGLEVLGHRRWALPMYLLAVGASIQLARTSIGYLDNLVADAALLVAAVAAVVAVSGRRGRILAVGAVTTAMLTHWFFTLLFLALLAGVVVTLLPSSIRAARSGQPRRTTPAWRLGTVVGASALGSAVATLVAPAFATRAPPAGGGRGGRATSLGPLLLPATLPLAAAGAGANARRGDPVRRAGLTLAVLWAATVPLGLALNAVLPGEGLKVFRIAAFALGIPVLIAAAATAAASIPRRVWVRIAGGVLGAAVLVPLYLRAGNVARSAPEGPVGRDLHQARIAAAYLASVPPGRPVVFLSAGPSPRMLDTIARSEVPVRLIEDVWTYPGTIEDLERGGPSTDTKPRVEAQSKKWWDQVWTDPRAVLSRHPIVLYLSEFNRLLDPPAGATPIAPGVLVVRGPPPSPNLGTGGSAIPGPAEVRWVVVWMLLLLFAAGSGWAAALLDGSFTARVAIAPAVGICALILVGGLLGRVGLDATGATRWVIVAAVAAGGWVAAWRRARTTQARHS